MYTKLTDRVCNLRMRTPRLFTEAGSKQDSLTLESVVSTVNVCHRESFEKRPGLPRSATEWFSTCWDSYASSPFYWVGWPNLGIGVGFVHSAHLSLYQAPGYQEKWKPHYFWVTCPDREYSWELKHSTSDHIHVAPSFLHVQVYLKRGF